MTSASFLTPKVKFLIYQSLENLEKVAKKSIAMASSLATKGQEMS